MTLTDLAEIVGVYTDSRTEEGTLESNALAKENR